MNSVLVLSPHLDDAAFSLGPLLAQYAKSSRFIVATAFSKSVNSYSSFALACQLDKGLSADEDYMAIRKKEDTVWAKAIGIEAIYGELPEAPHRGYNSAAELFGSLLPEIDLREHLFKWIEHLLRQHKPLALLSPLSIGNHVDHILIRETVERFNNAEVPVYFYKDLPYAADSKNISAQHYFHSGQEMHEHPFGLFHESIEAAHVATNAYKTQIPFQFGDANKMRIKLVNAWGRSISLYSLNTHPTRF
jgi:LmbE family N-acetylglucosaminyl deacetylase